MKLPRILAITIVLMLSTTFLNAQESEGLQILTEWMTGEFDSSAQEKSDSSYYNISLKMTRIWPNMPNGVWIYVEQAVADTPNKPYRQRVYFVSEMTEDNFSSDIYTLKNDSLFIGAWKEPERFDAYKPFDLKYKEGCTVYLTYDGFQYGGETNEKSCKSELRGASYATSQVIILEDQLQSWDRGYDENDEQVWGAVEGPYIFQRIK